MKLVLIVYNITLEDEVQALLKDQQVTGLTQWPRIWGCGTTSGSRFDTSVWPGANSGLMVVTEEAKARALFDAVQELRDTAGKREGVNAFILNVEAVTGLESKQ